MYHKNAWEKYHSTGDIMKFADGYKEFLSYAKTERLAFKKAIEVLKKEGFVEYSANNTYIPGDKIYFTNKNKNIVAYVIGEKAITEGLHILGAHIDSPRLDFKEHPLYQDQDFVLADTHYYGGIKKYQWVTIPLALHGVVVKKDGTTIDVNIGEKEDDPVFGITDLLIHLADKQMDKSARTVIEGENLDATLGSMPIVGDKESTVKDNIFRILKDKYNIEEEDFVSAEIEVVPAGKARDYGLDCSMIAGYGHDDRSCAYSSLMAFVNVKKPTYTSALVLVDKEEIGSVGATGMHSAFFENTLIKLLFDLGYHNTQIALIDLYENSKMLSSDVSAALDPLYSSVSDNKNAAKFGHGLVFNKYTGSRGKSGSNDANPEYYAYIRKVMDDANVNWQSSELGKVDQGGGGTIAYILGNKNMNVIDAGIAVLNMHAPMEIISKVDLYEAYLGYKAFLLAK